MSSYIQNIKQYDNLDLENEQIVNRHGQIMILSPRAAPESKIDFLRGNGTDLSRIIRV